MLKNNYICALDISSTKIAASLAEIKGNHITNIFFDTVLVKGVKKGAVVDSIELTGCIGSILKNLKSRSGINIKVVYANISGLDIVTKHSRAIIPLAERGNKVITRSDVHRAIEQARILGSSLEEEIIHQMPSNYTIDSKSNILNPLGLYSHRLEVDLYLVCGKLSSIQTLSRTVNQSGFELKGLFFSGIATSEVAFNHELKNGISVLCDIGSDITELIAFEDGLLKDIKILSVGGNDMTAQLSGDLKIPFDLAEDVKKSHGSAGDSSHINEDKEILVKKNDLYKPIKQKLVSQILTLKADSVCQAIKESLDKIVPAQKIDNFIVAGRTVLLDGFIENLENKLATPVKLARIVHPDIVPLINRDDSLSGQKYLTYLTSLGIVCQALKKVNPRALTNSEPTLNIIKKTINKVKEVYQEYF